MTQENMAPAQRKRADIAWNTGVITMALVIALNGLLYLYTTLTQTGADLIAPNGMPLANDFLSLWCAGWLAATGNPAGAYDPAALGSILHATVPATDSLTLFHYPPNFLLALLPLGKLPYLAALALFILGTLAWFGLYLWRMRPRWSTLLLVAGYPAMWLNLLGGQNGFLTGALLGMALLSASPRWQGLGWGLLTYKPQLGIPVPFALLMGKRLKTIIWAGVFTLLFAGLSLVLLGADTWQTFFADNSLAWQVLADGRIPYDRMASTFAAVRFSGFGIMPALLAQGLTAVIGLLAALAFWRSPQAPAPLKHASLIIAMLMATPHLFHYDLALLALPLLMIMREAEKSAWLAGERAILFLVWIGPFVALPSAETGMINFYPFLLIALQLLLLRRLRRASRGNNFQPC